ncbi:MAG: hypothetical protein IJV06_02890 [Bacteroidaceae bacterium]|nr:hypothetical protein [Bacteroidaceae bacterium]
MNKLSIFSTKVILVISIQILPFTIHAQQKDNKVSQTAGFPVRQETVGEYEEMMKNLRFEEMEEKILKEITLAKKRKKDVSALENLQEQCNRGLQMLRGTDKVTIIDSVVIDKKRFLDGYKVPVELGKLRLAEDGKSTEFETERGGRIYKSEWIDGKLQLISYYMEDGKPAHKKRITGLDVDGDLNYPFLMTDGITFYFAARSAEGLGNYDLYVTRYDYDEDKFYRAENLGFPYNSYANDYMMVIDEENNIGWFASDRYQPEGKVCIYTFIPNRSRHPYDYENEDHATIMQAASLHSFKSTWNQSNEQARIQAKQTLAFLENQSHKAKAYEFTLVINDNYTYHYYNDFHSVEAKKQCKEWLQKKSSLNMTNQQLNNLRDQYTAANSAKKKTMEKQILDMEKQVEALTAEAKESEKKIRNLELK